MLLPAERPLLPPLPPDLVLKVYKMASIDGKGARALATFSNTFGEAARRHEDNDTKAAQAQAAARRRMEAPVRTAQQRATLMRDIFGDSDTDSDDAPPSLPPSPPGSPGAGARGPVCNSGAGSCTCLRCREITPHVMRERDVARPLTCGVLRDEWPSRGWKLAPPLPQAYPLPLGWPRPYPWYVDLTSNVVRRLF